MGDSFRKAGQEGFTKAFSRTLLLHPSPDYSSKISLLGKSDLGETRGTSGPRDLAYCNFGVHCPNLHPTHRDL